MAERLSLIALFSGPAGEGLTIEHDEDRGIVVSAQADGTEVEICIPPQKWFAMARQIYASRSPLSLHQLANDR